MNNRVKLVAIEGRCCSGKSTLIQEMCEKWPQYFGSLPDYNEMVGGGVNLPKAIPASLSEEELSLRYFASLDQVRASIVNINFKKIYLIDRSVYSLFSHCYALTALTNISYDILAKNILPYLPGILWPNHIVYLNLNYEDAIIRNSKTIARESILMDYNFNIHLENYFKNLSENESITVSRIDASLPVNSLSNIVYEIFKSELENEKE